MRTGPNPCYCCRVDIKHPRYWVHPYDGGRLFVMQGEREEDLSIDAAGDLGWHPVGSDCARMLRAKGIHVLCQPDDCGRPHPQPLCRCNKCQLAGSK